jgi:hypothetical protein
MMMMMMMMMMMIMMDEGKYKKTMQIKQKEIDGDSERKKRFAAPLGTTCLSSCYAYFVHSFIIEYNDNFP